MKVCVKDTIRIYFVNNTLGSFCQLRGLLTAVGDMARLFQVQSMKKHNMIKRRDRPFDLLSVGELLIDFISADFADSLDDVINFKRLQGGSPANLCMNMARLSNRVKLVATVGKDDMGTHLLNCLKPLNIDTTHLFRSDLPTTLILVTRSKEVSNFEAYRAADCQISDQQFPDHLFAETTLFHTTCFALSKEPAQSTIVKAFQKAARMGCQLSIDANYAQKIWPDQKKAQELLKQYCSLGAIVKISEVDWERLYNTPLKDPKAAAQFLLGLGASEVCVTLGSEGCYAASKEEACFLPARVIEIKDTTGAGDAFWSGYLTAWLDGLSLEEKCKAGRKMAELKLGHFGPFPGMVERSKIYSD